MKNKNVKKLLAIVLIMTALAGCSAPIADKNAGKTPESESVSQENAKENATAGELADYFRDVAEKYQASANHTQILEGFKESEKATRLQMLVIASRAFGSLSAPEGYAKRIAAPAPDLAEVPEWAAEELKNLSEAGLLAASDLQGSKSEEASDSTEEVNILDEPVTMKDARTIAVRYFVYNGTELKDDFYSTVNRQLLNTLEIPEGEDSAGGSASVIANTDEQLKTLILEIVNSGREYPQGSSEQKIRDLYQNFENTEARDQMGMEPLQKYLDAVEQAGSFSELNAAIAQAVNELGISANGLLPGIPVTDTKDSTRKVLLLMTQVPGLAAADYENPDGEAYQEYHTTLKEQLLTVGESREEAENHADTILKLEKVLSENMTEQDDSGKIKEQKYYTLETLDEMMPQAKPSEMLKAIGLNENIKMQVFDDKQFEALTKWYTADNLELFKAIEKITLLTSYSSFLSTDLAERFGTAGVPTADLAVQNYLSEELGELYTERYFPEESKAEVEKMVNMLIETFKERISRLDWMEETTKKEALKKLESLTVLIGFPDQWDFNPADIKGAADGGSFFENAAASEAGRWKKQLEELENPVDPRRFPLAAYTVNAAASRNTNTIIFPAGILQAPFYDRNGSFEANLAAIGSTIAHEITHMFDDGWAQYDAEGNVTDWWEKTDYEHFRELCKKVENFYDGREAAPGIRADGKATLSENIADIGGIACGLDVLSKMENPDYDAFFRSYANQWLRVADYSTLEELAQSDIHAPNNLRCNMVLSNFQEFYDTYGIREGDGMYVAPEDRITIW